MTPEHQKILDRWAEVCQQHAEILEFLQWAESEQHIEFGKLSLPVPEHKRVPEDEWPDGRPPRQFASFTDILNVYFDVDAWALDNARRALLNEAFEAGKK